MGSRAPSAAGSRGGPPSLIPTRSAGRISFSATSPSRRRIACGLGDFTYLRCWEGVLYFSFVIDVFLRMIVGWQLASHMRTDLVLDALRMALGLRAPGADFELVADTDAGSQYTSADYTQVLDDHRVLASIGSAGDADDNALAESFVDSDKTELIADRVWRSRTQLELATVEECCRCQPVQRSTSKKVIELILPSDVDGAPVLRFSQGNAHRTAGSLSAPRNWYRSCVTAHGMDGR